MLFYALWGYGWEFDWNQSKPGILADIRPIVYVTHVDPIDQINPTLHCNRNTKHDNFKLTKQQQQQQQQQQLSFLFLGFFRCWSSFVLLLLFFNFFLDRLISQFVVYEVV